MNLDELNKLELQDDKQNHDLQKNIERIEQFIKSHMTKDANVRYGTVKLAYPDKALNALGSMAKMIEGNRSVIINDEMLKNILKNV